MLCGFLRDELGRRFVQPEGAFYLMLDVRDTGRDSLSVALDLLKDGVATIPGAAFGSEGEGFLRLSFACEQPTLLEGLGRLKRSRVFR
ncbi:MAG TPA: aminotransferase class I/II-fold pyridoxal phosphate-dependent enzyme [Acidobacteriota bacterium]|nr:aminotransferase class I/II-fold pyridoxal phosphate-dependent enzyme [Acidobacteriota bacterium]